MIPLSQLADQWSAISDLLDRALALPAHERLEFVSGLQGDEARFRETLVQLLSQPATHETNGFLLTLPRLSGDATPASLGDVTEGGLVGPYRVIRELGAGGMGAVWLAERADGSLKRKVALKLPRLAWGRGLAERLKRERDILAALEHPNIARLYDAGVDHQGRPYLALEYVDGQPIDTYAREQDLDTKARLDLLLQVAGAVAFAHSRLVVHRDLKPQNILVGADGQAHLLDFGIAKLIEGDRAHETQLTRFTGCALTPDYASPEQIRGEAISTASDVYSFGVVAYELLTGAKPYRLKRGSTAELEEAIASTDPPSASEAATEPAVRRALKGDLDAILNKALKKLPAERYETVAALADDLHHHLAGRAVRAQADTLAYRARKFVGRHRIQVGIAVATVIALIGGAYAQVAVVLALACGTALALWQRNKALEQAHDAREQRKLVQTQAARAEQVKQFLISIFEGADLDAGRDFKVTAGELLSRAHAQIMDRLDTDSDLTLELKISLASTLIGVGEHEQAVRLLEPLMGSAERRLGANHPLIGQAQLRLGQALLAADLHSESAHALDRAIANARARDDVALLGAALRFRCDLMTLTGKYRDALELSNELVQLATLRSDRLPPVLPMQMLITETKIRINCHSSGQLESSERALDAAMKVFGTDTSASFSVAHACWLHAHALTMEGDLDEGFELYERIRGDMERLLHEAHPKLLDFYNSLGQAYLLCGSPRRATECFRLSLAISERIYGARSFAASMERSILGRALRQSLSPMAAIAELRACIELQQECVPAGHPTPGYTKLTLIGAMRECGLFAEAAALLEEVEPHAASTTQHVQRWHFERVSLLAEQGLVDEAQSSAEHAIELEEQNLAELDVLKALLIGSGGVAHFLLGQPRLAEPLLVRSVELSRQRHLRGSTTVGLMWILIGRVRLVDGRPMEAVGDFAEAAAWLGDFDASHVKTGHAWAYLALASELAGTEDGGAARARAKSILKRTPDSHWRRQLERLLSHRPTMDCADPLIPAESALSVRGQHRAP